MWSKGICYPECLFNCCENVKVAAYFMMPSLEYEGRVESLLDKSLDRVDEILRLPIMEEFEGKSVVNHKNASLVLQVTKMLDMRVRGGYIQRIEEKSMQVHGTAADAEKMFGHKDSESLEAIEARIRELESSGKVSLTESKRIPVGAEYDDGDL
jgi:hypothetical protein